MKNKMVLITACLGIGFAIFLPLFLVTQNATVEAVTITIGVTLYHFAMRLAVGTIVDRIMKNKADHENLWFREKRFESKLYKLIGVRSYLPLTFYKSCDIIYL